MRAWIAVGALLVSSAAEAYVGPGIGVGVVGAILGAVVAIVLAFAGIVWYPIKRLLKRRRPEAANAGQAPEATVAAAQEIDKPSA